MATICKAAAVKKLPEEIRRMRVGMAGLCSFESGIETNHQEHETWSDAVDKIVGHSVRVSIALGLTSRVTSSQFRGCWRGRSGRLRC